MGEMGVLNPRDDGGGYRDEEMDDLKQEDVSEQQSAREPSKHQSPVGGSPRSRRLAYRQRQNYPQM